MANELISDAKGPTADADPADMVGSICRLIDDAVRG
ncbi:hypothetical protein BLJAPNOD_04680 [Ensifer sp. M14]|nr:hypothetical protein BLJAPNOD_04680 [Ensifer sp. M14]